MNFQFFSGQAVSQNGSKSLIVKGFYLLRMSNDYYFRRTAEGRLSQRNRRNTATVLRAAVKSHNRLKERKLFACGWSGRNLKSFSRFTGKSPCWGPFTGKLLPVIAYKRLLGQLYQKRDAYTETLTQVLSVNLEKNMNTTITTSARLPLKLCQIWVCYLQFSYVLCQKWFYPRWE